MVIYRVFCTKDKTMQDCMNEILHRALEEYWGCQIHDDNVKLNYLRIKDSILN